MAALFHLMTQYYDIGFYDTKWIVTNMVTLTLHSLHGIKDFWNTIEWWYPKWLCAPLSHRGEETPTLGAPIFPSSTSAYFSAEKLIS